MIAPEIPPARRPLGGAFLAIIAVGCTLQETQTVQDMSFDDTVVIPIEEYAERRQALMARLPDGIVLLQARPTEKSMEQWGFVQDPTFLYYTGLAETPGAILALDGAEGRAHIFLPPAPMSFGMPVQDLVPAANPETAQRLGLDSAHPWEMFAPWVRDRLDAGSEALYLDEPRRPEATGVPEGMRPVAGRGPSGASL